jgi:predicted ester cyclase
MLMSTEQNKAVVRRYFEEVLNQRALSIVDEIFEDSSGPLKGVPPIVTAFPDFQCKIVDQVAERDNVATVWTAKGTHLGEWLSPIGAIAPTGKPVTWSGTTTFIVRNGRIAGMIGTNWDHLGILQQMGVIANTAPRPGG